MSAQIKEFSWDFAAARMDSMESISLEQPMLDTGEPPNKKLKRAYRACTHCKSLFWFQHCPPSSVSRCNSGAHTPTGRSRKASLPGASFCSDFPPD